MLVRPPKKYISNNANRAVGAFVPANKIAYELSKIELQNPLDKSKIDKSYR